MAAGFLLLLVGSVVGIKWTGLGTNNLWNNRANWDPIGIPSITDDVIINGANVLVGTADGAKGASITLSGATVEVRGCTMDVTGNLNVENSTFTIDSGAGAVGGKAVSVDAGSAVVWKSGTITGGWSVAGSLTALVTGGGLLQCANGTVANSGKMTFPNATQLIFGCDVKNDGAITFSNLNEFATAQYMVKKFPITSGAGTVSISGGPIQFGAVSFKNVAIAANSDVTINLATASLSTVSVGAGAKLEIHESTVSITGLTGTGSVNVAIGSTVTFGSGLQTGTLKVDAGHAIIKSVANTTMTSLTVTGGSGFLELIGSKVKATNVDVSAGVLSADGTSTVTASYTKVDGGDGFFMGGGVVTTKQLSTANFLKVAVNMTVTQSATIMANVALDQRLTIPKNIVLTIPKSGASVWGPSNASKPGVFDLEGQVQVLQGSSLTMNAVQFAKVGVYIVFGKLDIQAATFATHGVALNDASAVFQAEGSTLNYDILTGPQNGVTIALYTDKGLSTCTSPCQGQNTFFQSYKATVQ